MRKRGITDLDRWTGPDGRGTARTAQADRDLTKPMNPSAGQPADPAHWLDVSALMAAYYRDTPDPAVPGQRVAFGTSGHRGSAFHRSFNEGHVLAISGAICAYRKQHHIDGPLFLGRDTHAVSAPAFASVLEVLAAHGVEVMISAPEDYTPTPTISHAILTYNRGRQTGLADGIVITPSHNPPEDGGLKYNPPTGGPAAPEITRWIEAWANEALTHRLKGVRRMPCDRALQAATTHRHDYLDAYVRDLDQVIDMAVIREAKIPLGVDPLGGAGVHYWPSIAHRYGLDLTVVNDAVDPTFRFMTVDWDGRVWTTDKDGIVAALLSAEMTARTGRDPGTLYHDLTNEFGAPAYRRVDAPVTPEHRAILERLSVPQVQATQLAGEKIEAVLTHAPGNGAALGGVKVCAENGWFAVRPSGTEAIYKLYAESFQGDDHLRRVMDDAQAIVHRVFVVADARTG